MFWLILEICWLLYQLLLEVSEFQHQALNHFMPHAIFVPPENIRKPLLF